MSGITISKEVQEQMNIKKQEGLTEEEKLALEKEEQEKEEKAKLEKEKKEKEEAEELARKEAEEKTVESEIVVIDDVEYLLDENGNATIDGEIKITAEELQEFEEENVENDFTKISSLSGISLTDDDGLEIEFEDSIEGFAKREISVYEKGIKEGYSKGIESFLNDNPDIKDIFEFKQKFGTIESYSKEIDYDKISLNQEDESQLESIIRAAETHRGNSSTKIDRLINYAKSDKTLFDDATEALSYLQKIQSEKVESIEKERQIAIEQMKSQHINYYGVDYSSGKEVIHNVEDSMYDIIVNKGSIGDVRIPEAGLIVTKDGVKKNISRKDLFDYIAKPVANINGQLYSQAYIDEMERLKNPNEVILQMIRNLDGGFEQLVKETSNTKEVKRILARKKVIKTKKSTNPTSKGKDVLDKIVIK